MKNEYSLLHSIGDLCKMCGVTRRMVLNYEEHNLISPVKTDPNTGYRYYNATSAARICHIKALQNIGFSLNNIREFISGNQTVLENHLSDLENLKEEIENQIYRTKALLTPYGDYSIHIETLPQADYFTITQPCSNPRDRFALLWDITDYVFEKGWQVSNKGRSLISIIHSDSDSNTSFYGNTTVAWALASPNSETVHFPETKALTLNIRGPYSLLPEAFDALKKYAKEHNYTPSGDVRIAYLTSPQSHADTNDFVTQMFLPIT